MRGAVRHAVVKTIGDCKNGYDLNVGSTLDPGETDDEMNFTEKEDALQKKMKKKVRRLLKNDKFTKRKDSLVCFLPFYLIIF